MELNILIALAVAWIAPVVFIITLIFILIENWQEYRCLCYGFIIGIIWGLLLYISIVPSIFEGVI